MIADESFSAIAEHVALKARPWFSFVFVFHLCCFIFNCFSGRRPIVWHFLAEQNQLILSLRSRQNRMQIGSCKDCSMDLARLKVAVQSYAAESEVVQDRSQCG